MVGIFEPPDGWDFDLTAPGFRADPYPAYRWVREHEPRHAFVEGGWLFTRHADASAVLRDPRFSSDPRHRPDAATFDALAPEEGLAPLQLMGEHLMLFLDPPDHTRLRGLVNRAFTPTVVEALRPAVSRLVDGLLDAVEPQGGMDLIADFAYPLPVAVICEMLGVPEADRPQFSDWSGDLVRLLDPIQEADVLQRGLVAGLSFVNYFGEFFEERRRAPRDDLVSALLAVEEEGDVLSAEELMSTCILLLIAGHETTQNLIGNGILALLRNREQLARVRDDTAVTRSAIEELLRFDSPVQFTARTATEDLDLRGTKVRAGEQVVLVIGSANRDSAVFDNGEQLDVTRSHNPHVAFGHGIHFCLGAPLARLEGQVAIPALLRRLPNLELAVDEPQWRAHVVLRGLAALPLRW